MLGTSQFLRLHEMAACCYFGANLGNGLDHNFPSRLTDGTPHSSSDLLHFTLLLPFNWTSYSKYNSLPLSYSLGQKNSKSNNSSLSSSDKTVLNQNSIFSLFFLDKKIQVQLQIHKNILSPIFLLT